MRIGLNLLHALREIGGGWNYIANLVAALGDYDDANTYIAFVTHDSRCLVPAKQNFQTVFINLNSRSRPRRVLYENTMLQLLAYKYHLDCMHWFANTQAIVNTVPGAVTIHDLQAFRDLVPFSRPKRLYLQLMMRLTAKRARILLPVSEATARELQRVLNVASSKMVVIPVIIDSCFRPATYKEIVYFKSKYGLPDHFWLYVAHFYPHKNHLRLLQAYHRLKANRSGPLWPLVLRGDPAGAEVEIEEAIAHLDLKHDVVFLPRLSEEEMPILYSAATGMIFPSLYEGGGIPVVEAIACGCPVAASDIPPIREFAGEAVLYFDPLDLESVAQTILKLQNSSDLRESQRRLGLGVVEKFRQWNVIPRLLDAYRWVANSKIQRSEK